MDSRVDETLYCAFLCEDVAAICRCRTGEEVVLEDMSVELWCLSAVEGRVDPYYILWLTLLKQIPNIRWEQFMARSFMHNPLSG